MAQRLGEFTLGLDGSALPARELIGGKAWSIARMLGLGLRVPPAVVVTTDACRAYLEAGAFPAALEADLDAAVAWLEADTGRTLGGATQPLLLSVRSGAQISMPGMMDTVLNLGINDATEAALAAETGDADFARDTHCRFLDLYARIVLKATLADGVEETPAALRAALAGIGADVPATPREQLSAAVEAVFASWNTRRAKKWRKKRGIPDTFGTAVTIQAMVFGNLGENSGTGVLFSRNTLSGAPEPQGEYLNCAQGEDVVSGNVTPLALDALAAGMPEVHAQLLKAAATLETENRDVQDIEFTVQSGELFFLQSRAAKRAPEAAVRIALDMIREGFVDTATALSRVHAEQVQRILETPLLPDSATAGLSPLASGESACPGVGSGVVVTDPDEAERRHKAGEAIVLASASTSPDDVHGMMAAVAILTEEGGHTSHAAVVSRDLGVPGVVGCGAGSVTALAGQTVTVDANNGVVYPGVLPSTLPREDEIEMLRELRVIAAEQTPLNVVPPANAPDAALDIDAAPGHDDPTQLASLLAGQTAICGTAASTEPVIRAALNAGVETIVAERMLPVLLTAIHAAAENT